MNKKEYLIYRHFAQKKIREYLYRENFIEATPPYLLKANAPDPHIDPLWVNPINSKVSYQLNTSPELWLKKYLAWGVDRLFSLGRVFRDDPPGAHHSLEFTMLEWYRSKERLSDLIADCEEIFALVAKAKSEAFGEEFKPINKFKTISVCELFKNHCQIDLEKIQDGIFSGDPCSLTKAFLKNNEHIDPSYSFQEAFFHGMIKHVEPKLAKDQPIVITRWPIQLAALSRPCDDNPYFCERFEVYFAGLEIANAYDECNDPEIIRARFLRENAERAKIGKPQFDMDEDFFAAIGKLGPMAGIALGFERLLMAISGDMDIKRVF